MPTPAIIHVGPDLLTTAIFDALEATDAEIGTGHESIDVGPLPDGRYVRLCADDLQRLIDQARRVLDKMEDTLLEARFDSDQASMHVCPGCPTHLPADLTTCGRNACERELALDTAGLR